MILIYFYLFLILKCLKSVEGGVINPQGLRYNPVPYLAARGQSNKEASGARIISSDPFIISLELPDKDPKDLGQTKRRKISKKRNRQKRETQGEDGILIRTKRCSRTDFLEQRKRDLQPIEKKFLRIHKRSKNRKNFKKEPLTLQIPDIPQNATSTGNQCPIQLVDDHTLDELIDDIKKIKEKLQKLLVHISSHETSEEIPEARFDGSNNGVDNLQNPNLEFINTVAEDIIALQKKIKYISDMINQSDEELSENQKPLKKADSPAVDLLEISEENPYVYELLREPENETKIKTNDQIIIRDKIKYLQSILKPNGTKTRKKREAERSSEPRSRKKRCAGNDTPVVSKSLNRERYKFKKWEDDLKLKRSQSKCPCGSQNNECRECRCTKCQKCQNRRSEIDELIETSEEAKNYLESTFKDNYPEENVLNWAKKSRSPVYDPFVEDLTLYRQRAKQILKNAQEILKRLKETEEQWAQKSGGEYVESRKWGDIDGMNERKYADDDVKDMVLELIYKVGKRLQEVREELEPVYESEDNMEAEESSNQEEAEEEVKDEKLELSHRDSSEKLLKGSHEFEDHQESDHKAKKPKDHHVKHTKNSRPQPKKENIRDFSKKIAELEGDNKNLKKSRDENAKKVKGPSEKSKLKESAEFAGESQESHKGNENLEMSKDKHSKRTKSPNRKSQGEESKNISQETEDRKGKAPNLKKSREEPTNEKDILEISQKADGQQGHDPKLKISKDLNVEQLESLAKKRQESFASTPEKSEELSKSDILKKLVDQTKDQVKSPKSPFLGEEESESSDESENHEEENLNSKKPLQNVKQLKSSHRKHPEDFASPPEKSEELSKTDILKKLVDQTKDQVKSPKKQFSREEESESSDESENLIEEDSNLKKSLPNVKQLKSSHRKHPEEDSATSSEKSEELSKIDILKKLVDETNKEVKSPKRQSLRREESESSQESENPKENSSSKKLRDQNLKQALEPSRMSKEEDLKSLQEVEEQQLKPGNLKKLKDQHVKPAKSSNRKSLEDEVKSTIPKSGELSGSDILEKLLDQTKKHVKNLNKKLEEVEIPENLSESEEDEGNNSNLKKSRDPHMKPLKSSSRKSQKGETVENQEKSEERLESKILEQPKDQTKKQEKKLKSENKEILEASQEFPKSQESSSNSKKSKNHHSKPVKSSTTNFSQEEILETPQKSEERLESDVLQKLIDQTKKHVKSKNPQVKELAEILQKSEEEDSNLKKPARNTKSFSLEDSFENDSGPSTPKTKTLSELLKLPGTDVMRDHRDHPPNDQSNILTTESPSEETSETFETSETSKENLETSNLGLNSTDSVEKLMDDFENGKMDEEDMKTMTKLNEEKINSLMDQLDEAEAEEERADEDEEGDCDEEEPPCDCECTDNNADVDKYEIMKSFLLWIKDMHMDNVLSN